MESILGNKIQATPLPKRFADLLMMSKSKRMTSTVANNKFYVSTTDIFNNNLINTTDARYYTAILKHSGAKAIDRHIGTTSADCQEDESETETGCRVNETESGCRVKDISNAIQWIKEQIVSYLYIFFQRQYVKPNQKMLIKVTTNISLFIIMIQVIC